MTGTVRIDSFFKILFSFEDTWTDYDENSDDVTGNTFYIGGSRYVIPSLTAYAMAQEVLNFAPDYHDAEGKEACWWWLWSLAAIVFAPRMSTVVVTSLPLAIMSATSAIRVEYIIPVIHDSFA